MASAQHRVVRPRVLQSHLSASNTVRTGPAACLGAPPTHSGGRACAGRTPSAELSALPKAAAASLTHAGFVRCMVGGGRRRSALLMGAVQLLPLVDSARNTARTGTARTKIAPLASTLNQQERAHSTVAGAGRAALLTAAPLLRRRVDSAGRMPANLP